jgi:hypothetical protein
MAMTILNEEIVSASLGFHWHGDLPQDWLFILRDHRPIRAAERDEQGEDHGTRNSSVYECADLVSITRRARRVSDAADKPEGADTYHEPYAETQLP